MKIEFFSHIHGIYTQNDRDLYETNKTENNYKVKLQRIIDRECKNERAFKVTESRM